MGDQQFSCALENALCRRVSGAACKAAIRQERIPALRQEFIGVAEGDAAFFHDLAVGVVDGAFLPEDVGQGFVPWAGELAAAGALAELADETRRGGAVGVVPVAVFVFPLAVFVVAIVGVLVGGLEHFGFGRARGNWRLEIGAGSWVYGCFFGNGRGAMGNGRLSGGVGCAGGGG